MNAHGTIIPLRQDCDIDAHAPGKVLGSFVTMLGMEKIRYQLGSDLPGSAKSEQ
jgi:hypothetical protein